MSEPLTMPELVDNYVTVNKANFWGETGLKNLNELSEALGYKRCTFTGQSAFLAFLSDNQGAQEAILEWLGQQDIPEWREALETYVEEDTDE